MSRMRLSGILLAALAISACSSPAATAETQPAVAPTTAAPTPQATTAVVEELPGLGWEVLTGNLDDKNFECQQFGDGVYGCERLETDGHLSAGAYGDGPSDIHTVTAEAEGQQSEEFIGFIATLPYDGAQPDAARAWVVDHFGSDATTTIGVATFSLSTEDGVTTLSISTYTEAQQ